MSEQQAGAEIQPMGLVTIPLSIYPALSVQEVSQVQELAARRSEPLPVTVGLLIRGGLANALAAEALPLAG